MDIIGSQFLIFDNQHVEKSIAHKIKFKVKAENFFIQTLEKTQFPGPPGKQMT